MFTRAASRALFAGATYWLYYIALEPYVRRLWPEMLVSWSRLLSGRLRDPLVGRDVLVGVLAFCVLAALVGVTALAGSWMGGSPRVSTGPNLLTLVDTRSLAGGIFYAVDLTLQISFLFLVSLLLLRIVVRNRRLLAACFVLVQTAVYLGLFATWFGGGFSPIYWLVLSLLAAGWTLVMFAVLTRAGLLAFVAMTLPSALSFFYPLISPSLSAWHAGIFLVPVAVLLGMATYGFRTALAGQPLFKDEILRVE